jgi:hypothetical protein
MKKNKYVSYDLHPRPENQTSIAKTNLVSEGRYYRKTENEKNPDKTNLRPHRQLHLGNV